MPEFLSMGTVVSAALESFIARPIKKVVRIAVGGIVKGAVKRAFLVGLPVAGAAVGVFWWRKRQRSRADSGPSTGEANQAESPSPQDSSASPGPSSAEDGTASDETPPETESRVKTPKGGDDASPEREPGVKAPEGGGASSRGVEQGQEGAAGDPLAPSEYPDSKGDSPAPPTGMASSGGGDSRTSSALASAAEGDDLTRVNGVGPKVAKVLGAAGITTYIHLAQMEVTDLRQLMREARISASVETWPAQAKLAAEGDWQGLQTRLRGR